MDRPDIFQLFEPLADTPDSVARLRKFILSLAVQGRLVPQDSNDEPAEHLVTSIRAGKQKLSKQLGMKGPESEIPLTYDDKWFTLPKEWTWVKLADLCIKLGAGSTPLGGRRIYESSGVKFLRSQNVWDNGLHLDDVAFIPAAIHKEMAGTHVEPGDILLNITGASIGRSAVVPDDFDEANVSQHVSIVRLVNKDLRRYLHLHIISPDFQKHIMDVQVGVSREGLSMARLKEFAVPLPPLAEQHRIVAKVEELLKLCDELESGQTTAREKRTRVIRSALDHLTNAKDEKDFRKHSSFILDNSSLTFGDVSELRKLILHLATHGKLVSPGTHDEPVRSRRRSEAAFDLPAGWQWKSLGQLGTCRTGKTPPTNDSVNYGSGFPFIGPGQITQNGNLIPPEKTITDVGLSNSTEATAGDILMVCIGGSIGKAAICREKIGFNQQINSIRLERDLPEFVYLVLRSTHFQEQVLARASGSATPIINKGKWEQIPIPIPPLSQQKRIVAKVNELMHWCDELESKLAAAQTAATHLLDATLHQILKESAAP